MVHLQCCSGSVWPDKALLEGWEDDDILLLAQGLKFTSVFLAQVPKTAATTEYGDCHTHLIGLVAVFAPLLLAPQGDAGGDDDVDEIAVVRHRGWLWKDSQMREGQVCTWRGCMHETMVRPSAHLSCPRSNLSHLEGARSQIAFL